MDPEPIPLRTLILLLNYERTTSDWRFTKTHLLNSSFKDTKAWSTLRPKEPDRYLPNKPSTLVEEHIHIFHPYMPAMEPENTTPLPTCRIHSLAPDDIQNLLPETRDLIFHISRGNNGSYFSIHLYDHFAQLCPPNQKLSIQIGQEEPYEVHLAQRRIIESKVHGPKVLSSVLIHRPNPKVAYFFSSGDKDDRKHAVIGLPHPKSDVEPVFVEKDGVNMLNNVPEMGVLVVDMASLEYGEAGKGLDGENYFMGTKYQWRDAATKYCDKLITIRNDCGTMEYHPTFTPFAKIGAKNVWRKWLNRDKVSWCSFCGVPGGVDGVVLHSCSECELVRYCGIAHQGEDYKMHHIACQKEKDRLWEEEIQKKMEEIKRRRELEGEQSEL